MFIMNFSCSRLLQCSVIASRKYSYQFFRISTPIIANEIKKLQHKLHKECYSSNTFSIRDQLKDIDCEFESSSQSNYEISDYDAITDGDSEKLKLVKKTQLELHLMAQQGEKVPPHLNTIQWRELIAIETERQRHRYLDYLWLNYMKNLNKKRKQEIKTQKFLELKKEESKRPPIKFTTAGPILYELRHNTVFFRITNVTIATFYNYKLLQAMMFDVTLIIDMCYENYMTRKELALCTKQLHLTFSDNRINCQPSHLIFCNTDRKNSVLLSKMNAIFPTLYENDFPFLYTKESYLDLYPKERIVYLTPHCTEELQRFEPNIIYIIGAIVDLSKNDPISLAKAKKEGLRMAKFPLDKYLNWHIGTKSLTINQCVAILNDLKNGADWMSALKHVPKRKLQLETIDDLREKRENRAFAKSIRENYRRNLVYDSLLKERTS